MTSFSGLGLGLSFLFGFVLLTLVGAELYYLLWWKKRNPRRGDIEEEETDCTIETTHEFPYLFFWKKPNSIHSTSSITHQSVVATNSVTKNPDPPDQEKKGFVEEEEGVEAELMRLHSLCGPPRFLFTIKEETREDLESEDGKSRTRSRKGSRSKSLSDLLHGVDMTPVASPLKSQSHHSLESFNHHGFNPLFESSNESELSSRTRCSPPPKFKFLRDAEEKLMRKLMEEAESKGLKKGGSFQDFAIEDRDGSFIRIIVGKNREQTASQVLPLASSPKALRSLDSNNKPMKV